MDLLDSAQARDTRLGRVNAATKIVLVAVLTAVFFVSIDWVSSAVGVTLLVVLMAVGGINPLRSMVALWPIFVAVLLSGWATMLLAEDSGKVWLDVGLYRLSTGSIAAGVAVSLRGFALGLISVMLLRSTDASDIGESLAQTFKLPARFVLSVVAAFRLVGILMAEWQALAAARRARGMGSGRGFVGWLTGCAHQSFSLVVQALRRAGRLAVTMEARGFGAGPRTWVNRPVYGSRDVIALALGLMVPILAMGTSLMLGTYRFLF